MSLNTRYLLLDFAFQYLFVVFYRSLGGLETDSAQSMAAWGINVGSKLAQGVSKIYSNFFSSGSASSAPSSLSSGSVGGTSGRNVSSPATSRNDGSVTNELQKGIVTILDVTRMSQCDADEIGVGERSQGIVAHFVAHNKVWHLTFLYIF